MEPEASIQPKTLPGQHAVDQAAKSDNEAASTEEAVPAKAKKSVSDSEYKLNKKLIAAKEKFFGLSRSLFVVDQEYSCLNDELKSLKAGAKVNMKKYIEYNTELALLQAELKYKSENISERSSVVSEVAYVRNKDVEKYRHDLEAALQEYRDARKFAKKFQQDRSQTTDASRIETLNFLAFCKYSQSVQIDEIRKLSSVNRRLPLKKEIAKSRSLYAKQIKKSSKDFIQFYNRKIDDFRRQERILIGRTRDVIERTMGKDASRMYAAGELMDEESSSKQSTMAYTVENRFVQRLVAEHEQASAKRRATLLAEEAAEAAAFASQVVSNQPFSNSASFIDSPSAATAAAEAAAAAAAISAAAGEEEMDKISRKKRRQRSALAAQQAAEAAAALEAEAHSRVSGRRIVDANSLASAAISALQQIGVGGAGPFGDFANGPASGFGRRGGGGGGGGGGKGEAARRALQAQLTGLYGSKKNALAAMRAVLKPVDTKRLFDADAFTAVDLDALPRHALLDLNPSAAASSSNSRGADSGATVSALPSATSTSTTVAAAGINNIETSLFGSVMQKPKSSPTATVRKGKQPQQLQNELPPEESLAQVVLQLCKAEGKFRQLNSIKEALDLHLVKQAHLLMLLSGDIHAELGQRIPPELDRRQSHRVTLEALLDAFQPPAGHNNFNANNLNQQQTEVGADAVGGAISGKYRYRIELSNLTHCPINPEVPY